MVFFARAVDNSLKCHARFSTLRSAPPLSPSVASQPTSHLVTSGAGNPSHQRIMVGRRALGRSLVTFCGITRNIVIQACCGHLPLFKLSQGIPSFIFSFLFTSPAELRGEITSHSRSRLVTYRCLSPKLLSILAVLPPNIPSPHSSAACPPSLAPPCCTANVWPTLAFFPRTS